LILTADASKEVLATYPTLPLPLLQVNTIISQFITSFCFPDLFTTTSILSLQEASTTMVHLHWLAIAGAVSFISSTLQIFPIDNSSGSKLSYAALGRENFGALNTIIGLARFIFFVPFLFSGPEAVNYVSKSRLFFDFIIISQLCGNTSETQVAKDNLSPITEGRKILYIGFTFILLLSYFPYQQIVDTINNIAGSLLNSYQDLL